MRMGNTRTTPHFYYKRAFGMYSKANSTQRDKSMEKLLDTGNNRLTLVMSTDAIMARSLIKEAKLHAESRSTLTGKTILPTITARAETQE